MPEGLSVKSCRPSVQAVVLESIMTEGCFHTLIYNQTGTQYLSKNDLVAKLDKQATSWMTSHWRHIWICQCIISQPGNWIEKSNVIHCVKQFQMCFRFAFSWVVPDVHINIVVGHQRTKRSEFANVASDLISVITLDNASKACVRVMLLAIFPNWQMTPRHAAGNALQFWMGAHPNTHFLTLLCH